MRPLFATRIFLLFNLLLTTGSLAQGLQVVNPDGSVFQSISVGQHVAIMLPNRFNTKARYAGRVTAIGRDSITMTIYRRSQRIAVSEIQGLRRVSGLGASVRRASRLFIPVLVGATGDVVGGLAKERPGLTRVALSVGASAGVGVLAIALVRLPPLKKAKNGYSFRVE